MSMGIVLRFALISAVAVSLGGCPGDADIAAAMKQLPAEAQVLLAKQGMRAESPLFVRIFKEESQLEIWKQKDDGRFYHFKTYPICAWSGALGPKVTVGDKQAPEGFYTISPGQLNPNSQFHLSFNLGYPNAYDKANGHTGDSLMVHGDCRSAGCFAMTDALIEEIYVLARESFQGGQSQFQVHAFPFRMTAENMNSHRDSKWIGFWRTLKEGYDAFEISRVPPKVAVCSRQYLVNADFMGHVATPDPASECPTFRKIAPDQVDPFQNSGPMQVRAPDTQGQSTRVAAYSTSAGQAASAQMRGVTGAQQQPTPPAMPEQPSASLPQQAVLTSVPASTPATTARQPLQPVQSADEQFAAPAPTTHEGKPEVTTGIHNVVQSGKSDMIVTKKAPARPAQQPVVGYEQAPGYGQPPEGGSLPD